MSLLDEALARQRPVGPECGVVLARQAFPKLADEIDELVAYLRSPNGIRLSYSNASALLKERGVGLSADTLSRHTRGLCGCGK